MDKTLHGWSKNFETINKNWIGMYEADVKQDYQRIENYHLPTYVRKFFEAAELVSNFEACAEQVPYNAYYIQLYPKIISLPKYSLTDFKEVEKVKEFIIEKVGDKLEYYFVLVSEFETNIYGGSIMSNGYSVYIDMCRGLQNQISYGAENSIGCKLQYEKISYSENAGKLEQHIFHCILSALRVRAGVDNPKFLKGYFEFAITKKNPDDQFYRLIFIDFKTDSQYYNI